MPLITKKKLKIKTRSLSRFKKKYPELCNYVEKIRLSDSRFKIVQAPVKSGKRLMVEINSLYDYDIKNINHIYLTALHRKADKKQREELDAYGIKVFSVNQQKIADKCIEYIKKHLDKDIKIIIHLDELDYGAGKKQLLSKIWSRFKTVSNTFFIKYSATSEVAQPEYTRYPESYKAETISKFKPPNNYYGIKKYLDSDKFKQATDFFIYNSKKDGIDLSEQANELIHILKQNVKLKKKRNIGILRLAGGFKIEGTPENNYKTNVLKYKTIHRFKDEIEKALDITLSFVGTTDNEIAWDTKKYWKNRIPHDRPTIIIINQVAGRSTAWKCHRYLAWYHTQRSKNTPLSTIIQDQERPVYYRKKYKKTKELKKPYDIKIYGDIPAALYSSCQITMDQYKEMSKRKINSRLSVARYIKKNVKVKTMIYNRWEEIPQRLRKTRKKENHINSNKKDGNGFYKATIRRKTKVWRKTEIEKEKKTGISDENRVRFTVFYEDDETDPNNYKYLVREFDGFCGKHNYKNSSMYAYRS